MPYRNQTGKALYVNADKSRLVEEDSPDAAFVLVGENGELSDDEARKYNLRGGEAPKTDPLAEAQAAHDDAMSRGAFEEARSHRNRVGDLEAQQDASRQARRSGPGAASGPKAVQPAENKGQ